MTPRPHYKALYLAEKKRAADLEAFIAVPGVEQGPQPHMFNADDVEAIKHDMRVFMISALLGWSVAALGWIAYFFTR